MRAAGNFFFRRYLPLDSSDKLTRRYLPCSMLLLVVHPTPPIKLNQFLPESSRRVIGIFELAGCLVAPV